MEHNTTRITTDINDELFLSPVGYNEILIAIIDRQGQNGPGYTMFIQLTEKDIERLKEAIHYIQDNREN